MKVQIKATAPTAYQYGSLRKFKLDYVKSNQFPITETKQFDTIDDARQYFKDLAFDYYDGNAKKIVANRGYKGDSLTLDAVTAYIEKIN